MNSPVIVIGGTNASGKSSLGVQLAREFNGEIISADSRQVYRGLDLGTGKLNLSEMQGIPHHLIDVADPRSDVFSVVDFQRICLTKISDIWSRGRIPFIVGGTGLYVSSVTQGYVFADVPPNNDLRQRLSALSLEELRFELMEVARGMPVEVDLNNTRRIIRSIEKLTAGAPLTDTKGPVVTDQFLKMGLTWEPEVLQARISARLASRIDAGMLDEIEDLRRHGLADEKLDWLGLEYRFGLGYLRGNFSDVEEFSEQLQRAIFRFSRRQIKWFKREPNLNWLDTRGTITTTSPLLQARALCAEFLSRTNKK